MTTDGGCTPRFYEDTHCQCKQCLHLIERTAHGLYRQLGLKERTSDYGGEHFRTTIAMVRDILTHMQNTHIL